MPLGGFSSCLDPDLFGSMILDTLDRSPLYHGLHPAFSVAFAWLASIDPSIADGRYEINGPRLFALVQHYVTAPSGEKKWEAHHLYGDIQYLVSGRESIGHSRCNGLKVRHPYSPDKDAEFYEPPASHFSKLVLEAGSFAIFFPQDAHQPGVMIDQPSPVLKVVIKFRLEGHPE